MKKRDIVSALRALARTNALKPWCVKHEVPYRTACRAIARENPHEMSARTRERFERALGHARK